jgi:hypothetical protein
VDELDPARFSDEINYDKSNLAEAVMITLGGKAYGITLNLSNFYSANDDISNEPGEMVRVNFYLNDELVGTQVFGGTATGNGRQELTAPGMAFDRVIIAAMDNGASSDPALTGDQNSDFTLNAIQFVTFDKAVVQVQEGTAGGALQTGDADGVSYAFDDLGGTELQVRLHGGTDPVEITLNQTGGTAITGSYMDDDGKSVNAFQVTLDANTGAWEYYQFKEFDVETGGSLQFTCVATDGDGDTTAANIVIANDSLAGDTAVGDLPEGAELMSALSGLLHENEEPLPAKALESDERPFAIGGDGNDIFSWTKEDLDGGVDTILDFAFGKDSLDFSKIFGTGDPDLHALLDDGNLALTLHGENDALQLTVTSGDGTLTIDMQPANADYTAYAEYVADPSDAHAAALLQQMLLANFGG